MEAEQLDEQERDGDVERIVERRDDALAKEGKEGELQRVRREGHQARGTPSSGSDLRGPREESGHGATVPSRAPLI